MEAAEYEFKLDRKASDGGSERDHIESAQRQIKNIPGWRGKKIADVIPEGPPFPDALMYLWAWFQEHAMGLEQNGMGPPVVTWQGLDAWCARMRIDLDPWEARTMVTLGVIRANIQAEKQKAEMKKR